MSTKRGEHASRKLKSGLEVHLIRHPGSDKWRIRSFDVSWVSALQMLTTKTWFPDKLGFGDKDFDSPDAACDFMEKHVHVRAAPPAPEGVVSP